METSTHVCPPLVGKLMISKIRRLYHHPEKILSPYVEPGQEVLEIGPGMGYFSLPLARLVGPEGKVYTVDIQPEMLNVLMLRAQKAAVAERLIPIRARKTSFGLDTLSQKIDFCLLFAVVHELPDQHQLFRELKLSLKKNAQILLAEPKGHVKQHAWEHTLELAAKEGLKLCKNIAINGSYACILQVR